MSCLFLKITPFHLNCIIQCNIDLHYYIRSCIISPCRVPIKEQIDLFQLKCIIICVSYISRGRHSASTPQIPEIRINGPVNGDINHNTKYPIYSPTGKWDILTITVLFDSKLYSASHAYHDIFYLQINAIFLKWCKHARYNVSVLLIS